MNVFFGVKVPLMIVNYFFTSMLCGCRGSPRRSSWLFFHEVLLDISFSPLIPICIVESAFEWVVISIKLGKSFLVREAFELHSLLIVFWVLWYLGNWSFTHFGKWTLSTDAIHFCISFLLFGFFCNALSLFFSGQRGRFSTLFTFSSFFSFWRSINFLKFDVSFLSDSSFNFISLLLGLKHRFGSFPDDLFGSVPLLIGSLLCRLYFLFGFFLHFMELLF